MDKEVSTIEDGLQRSKLRDQFQLVSKWAVDSNSLRRALLEENPDIVHFSGHGEGQAGLVLVGQDGTPKPATAEALCGLFKEFPNIKCVLLNACYAQVQAKAIVQQIDYVIGMKQAVRDDAAIAFATGFYDALGYGKSIDVAFALGCNAVQFELASFSATTRSRKFIPVDLENVETPIESLPDYLIPVLLKKEKGSTGSLTSPTPSSSETNSLSKKLRPKDDTIKTDALKIYRERVQEFLADLKLTQIEKFQLAILANVLGVSEADANRILQEEQDKQQYNARSTVTNRQSHFIKIGNAKNYLFVCGATLLFGLIGFAAMQGQTRKTVDYTNYSDLKNLLENQEWKNADEVTQKQFSKRFESNNYDLIKTLKTFPCDDLLTINQLWQESSDNKFSFSRQQKIMKDIQAKLPPDAWSEFQTQVGWKPEQNSFPDGQFPDGHFPAIGIWWKAYPEQWLETLGKRIDSCQSLQR